MALPKLRTNMGIDPAAAEQNALRTMAGRSQNRLAQLKLANYPAQQAAIEEQRQYDISRRPVLEASQGLAVLRQLAPGMDMNMYLTNRDAIMQATGLPEVFLPTAEQIQANAAEGGETPEQSFESLKAAWSGQEAPTPEEPEAPGWSAPREGVDPQGNPIVYRVNKGSGEIDVIEGVLPKPKSGERIDIDPETNRITFVRGPGVHESTTPEMTKRTQGTIEDSLIQAQDSSSRLRTLKRSYNERYLRIWDRFGFMLTGWRDKLKGSPIEKIIGEASTAELEEAEGYWAFRQDSVANLNKEIKWLTGAAMNREEVPRLTQEVPNAGLGMFDGDSPRQFEKKLLNKLSQVNLYIARYAMMLRRGVMPSEIKSMGRKNELPGEAEVRNAINNYGKALEEQGIAPEEIKKRVQEYFHMI